MQTDVDDDDRIHWTSTRRFRSRMYLPTLYAWLSSNALSYFQPRTVEQTQQVMSRTTCNPVVMDRSLDSPSLMFTTVSNRYARPCWPWNALDIMLSSVDRCVKHLEQPKTRCPTRYRRWLCPIDCCLTLYQQPAYGRRHSHRRYLVGQRVFGCSKCFTHLSTLESMISRVRRGWWTIVIKLDSVVSL